MDHYFRVEIFIILLFLNIQVLLSKHNDHQEPFTKGDRILSLSAFDDPHSVVHKVSDLDKSTIISFSELKQKLEQKDEQLKLREEKLAVLEQKLLRGSVGNPAETSLQVPKESATQETEADVHMAPASIISHVHRTEALVNKELIFTIFNGLDPFSVPPAVKPDWTYPHTNWQPAFFEYMWTKYIKPNHVEIEFYLEVGSFKAGSITLLAALLKEKYNNWKLTSLICMDPFTGDVNMWDWNDGKNHGHDFLAMGLDGRPRIYETYMANVVDKGHQDMILPITVGGLVGMKLLLRLKQQGRISQPPGIIYLDSAHEKDETYLELMQAWDLLRDCGAIMGDDWGWIAVKDDAIRFAKNQNLQTLPVHPMNGNHESNDQPVPGLIVGPKGQWFIIKNIDNTCKYDAEGAW